MLDTRRRERPHRQSPTMYLVRSPCTTCPPMCSMPRRWPIGTMCPWRTCKPRSRPFPAQICPFRPSEQFPISYTIPRNQIIVSSCRPCRSRWPQLKCKRSRITHRLQHRSCSRIRVIYLPIRSRWAPLVSSTNSYWMISRKPTITIHPFCSISMRWIYSIWLTTARKRILWLALMKHRRWPIGIRCSWTKTNGSKRSWTSESAVRFFLFHADCFRVKEEVHPPFPSSRPIGNRSISWKYLPLDSSLISVFQMTAPTLVVKLISDDKGIHPDLQIQSTKSHPTASLVVGRTAHSKVQSTRCAKEQGTSTWKARLESSRKESSF